MNKDYVEKLIVKHYAGSIAYGTNTPESDTDFRGIFLAPKEYIITPFQTIKEVEDKSEEDTKFFEMNNYAKLYLTANPNILETMWVRPEDITESTDEYWHLRKYSQQLLSTKIAYTYTGYAYNQATRMKNHHTWMDKERTGVRILQELINKEGSVQLKEWITDTFPDYISGFLDFSTCNKYIKGRLKTDKYMRNPSLQMLSTEPLKQCFFIKLVHNYFAHQVLDRDFDIMDYNTDYELLPYGDNIFGVVQKQSGKCINTDGSINKIDTDNRTLEDLKQLPKLIVKFNADEYNKNSDNRKSYHQWKKNRNSARAELEQTHQYDTKFAMHTIRLLRTAKEALEDGVVQVYRPDAKELLDIRNGSWTYDEVMQYCTDMTNEIRNVILPKSVLPKQPDIKLATKVLVDIREMQWYGKK